MPIPFPRPTPNNQQSATLGRAAYELARRVKGAALVRALVVILTENWSLTQEVNQHRTALGIEPLPTNEPNFGGSPSKHN